MKKEILAAAMCGVFAVGVASATGAIGASGVVGVAGSAGAAGGDVDFDKSFNDSTLRVDYVLAGNADNSAVYIKRQSKTPGWYGRRHNLDKLPYIGNGVITMTDAATGDTIYRHPFSTLFSEWQSTDEAKETNKAFENSFILPLPKGDTDITIELLDKYHKSVARNRHRYRPDDVLVAQKPMTPYEVRRLHQGGDPKEVIDIAILAEGYTKPEMEKFFTQAQKVVDAIFSHEPFKSRAKDFNFTAVGSESAQSGVSTPKNNDWRNTLLGSHYSTFYSDRYLTAANEGGIHDALTGVPYENIIVLANAESYGGGGIYNSYTLTTAGHETFTVVCVHEFGHGFGGLCDEYFYDDDVMSGSYPLDVEPWEPNITTLVDFDSKWKGMLKPGTPIPTPVADKEKYPVGVYEGGGYTSKGVYRPADECRMRNNTWPTFCPVCDAALNKLIDFYTK